MTVSDLILYFFYYFFLIYSLFIFSIQFIILFISGIEAFFYFKKNNFVDYTSILSSPFSPTISVLIPIYNEERNVLTTIRGVLMNHYVNYNIIVINDGSTDNSLMHLIKEFNLEKTDFEIIQKIETKEVKAVYKSKNKAFQKLIVIDKVNGGKSDALNVGINISNNQYIACVDADCILVEDALQKMIKPFLDTDKIRVIASGGVIRIANSCIIKDSKLVDVNLSGKLIVRFQTLEYLRAFLLARIGWSKCKGLMVVSGAFGILDREIVLEVNGYNNNTLGEDMDILIKMQRYMCKQKQEYRICYIPDPLCWTETPSSYKVLNRQRKRWSKGTIENVYKHRNIAFNPKYGLLGMFSYPYWFIYERFGFLIELIGILYFLWVSYCGLIGWVYSISFLMMTYLFSISFSTFAVLAEEVTYHQYKKKGDLRKIIFTALLDPFTYHLFLLYSALTGNIESLLKVKKRWGDMERKGLELKL